jgi:hypothetical protein
MIGASGGVTTVDDGSNDLAPEEPVTAARH